jgi:hypothetical protein
LGIPYAYFTHKIRHSLKPGLLDGFPFRFIIQRLNFGFFIEE